MFEKPKAEVYLMKEINIDETKLPAAMKIIEQAAELMAERDCVGDEKAKQELENFQQELRKIAETNRLLDLKQQKMLRK